ncbi:MAG: AraC family transcriptional regulator [Alphaproteobacteria bacterium]|nr:AraC family transcriptional regulator [Alphaproteobacteria bacterium]
MVDTQSNAVNYRALGRVEKLIEYRTAHYAAYSEAASYFTNTPARVSFRFANPIICGLKSGVKIMSVEGGPAFDFFPGDVMYVAPGLEIDIDLGAATRDNPIECDCFEIETGRLEGILSRLNERMKRHGNSAAAALDWSAHSVLRGDEAQELGLSSLMDLFRGHRDVFSDLRIDARIDETILRLMQSRTSDLIVFDHFAQDSGIHAAAHLIRENLGRHLSSEELARAAALSETSLHRQFRKFFGTTPARFANKLRITEAKHRLRQTRDPIEILAFELGFSDASHFSREFRKTTGESPAEYRKRRQQPPNMLDW